VTLQSGLRPGPWLGLCALLAAAATALVIASAASGLGSLHMVLSLAALAPLVALTAMAKLAHPRLRRPAYVATALLIGQVGLGALVAATGDSPWVSRSHVAASALCLAAVLVVAVRARGGSAPEARGAWRDYVTLTKPRIMVLLLLTAACGMFVAAQGMPAWGTFAATMAGLALACGGASALNHVMDRDIDIHMARTDRRPVAAKRVAAPRALEFGLALSAFSFVLLACATNLLTALLALIGNLFYVVVYTGYLKRRTAQNIVIGGAAGAVPPLVGYAAVSGNLTLTALILFLIVFVWTPPHFWALALLIQRDYRAAGVPMLPVVRGASETARMIVRYSALLVLVTLLPVVTGELGWAYAVFAVLLGGTFVWLAVRLRSQQTPQAAKMLFHYSLLYLALVFVAMAAAAAV
jgi:protoheme IX farnesyltransferase